MHLRRLSRGQPTFTSSLHGAVMALLGSALLTPLGCGLLEEKGPLIELDAVTPSPEAKADGHDIRLRVGETSLWLRPNLRRERFEGEDVLVLRGRTSRNITGGNTHHPGDPGTFHQPSPRVFSLSWPATTIARVLDGRAHLVEIELLESEGRADQIFAHAELGAHVQEVRGELRFEADLMPLVRGMNLVHRLRGRAPAHIHDLAIQAGEVFVEAEISGQSFFVDLDPASLAHLASTGEPLLVTAWLDDHVRLEVQVVLGAAIRLVEAGAGLSAEQLWPPKGCSNRADECLASLLEGTLNLGACGEAGMVLDCRDNRGYVIEGIDVEKALSRAEDRLAQLSLDATVLVGEQRSAKLCESVAEELVSALLEAEGAWLLDELAATAALDEIVESVFSLSYARPLRHVRALEPRPHDEEHAAQMSADALLLYLGASDLRRSEYRSTLENLVARWTSGHLEAFHEIRVGGVELWRDSWIVVVSWLSSYSEVRVDPATGEVFHIVTEIP